MKHIVLAIVGLCVLPINAQQKCDCVYPYHPDPPCVHQCTSIVMMAASKEELESHFGLSPQDASKLLENRSSLRTVACETEPQHGIDTNEVSAKLETSITQLIGNAHYNAAVSRFQDLTSKRPKSNFDVFAKVQSTDESTAKKLRSVTVEEICH